VGTLSVGGEGDLSVFRSLSNVPGSQLSSHDMSGMTPAAAKPATPPAATTPPPSTGSGGGVTLDMTDNAFSQTAITVASGSEVQFTAVNKGKLPHNLRIAPANGDFDSPQSSVTTPEIVNAGKTGTLTWKAAAPGTYKFRCDIHPEQMTGVITVN
jgi:plastocyanin